MAEVTDAQIGSHFIYWVEVLCTYFYHWIMRSIRNGFVNVFLCAGLIVICTRCKQDCELIMMECELIPDSGPCEAAITKYYFDSVDEVCKAFVWGGCEGIVPFDSMEECQQCECR